MNTESQYHLKLHYKARKFLFDEKSWPARIAWCGVVVCWTTDSGHGVACPPLTPGTGFDCGAELGINCGDVRETATH